VLTTPLLLSWDGEKMSSSQGNNIPLTAPPEEMFGRTMRLPDTLLPDWYRLVVESDEDPLEGDPLEAKLRLAAFVTARSHGEDAARRAEDHFTRVVREGRPPEDVPEAPLPEGDPLHLPALLHEHGLAPSTSEARRLIAQGAVRIEGARIADLDVPRDRLRGATIQAGKRKFMRFVGT
jgi:tyrosyl-tRNA synthetase